LLAEKGESPGLVLGPSLARRAEPDRGLKGVAWSELRVVELAKPAVFFQKAVEQHHWAQGLSLLAEKQALRVKRGESQAQVKLEWQVEARREFGSSQNPEAERVIPVLR
jgi:hypothetical protein